MSNLFIEFSFKNYSSVELEIALRYWELEPDSGGFVYKVEELAREFKISPLLIRRMIKSDYKAFQYDISSACKKCGCRPYLKTRTEYLRTSEDQVFCDKCVNQGLSLQIEQFERNILNKNQEDRDNKTVINDLLFLEKLKIYAVIEEAVVYDSNNILIKNAYIQSSLYGERICDRNILDSLVSKSIFHSVEDFSNAKSAAILLIADDLLIFKLPSGVESVKDYSGKLVKALKIHSFSKNEIESLRERLVEIKVQKLNEIVNIYQREFPVPIERDNMLDMTFKRIASQYSLNTCCCLVYMKIKEVAAYLYAKNNSGKNIQGAFCNRLRNYLAIVEKNNWSITFTKIAPSEIEDTKLEKILSELFFDSNSTNYLSISEIISRVVRNYSF